MSPENAPLSSSSLFPSRRAVGIGLLAGLAHLIVVAALTEWFDLSFGRNPFLVYVAVGALSLGALPAALFVEHRLVAPSIAVALALVASTYGTWSVYVAPETIPTPVGPTPFGWYLIGWVAVVGVALIAGGVEYGIRRAMVARGE
ncbi:hypothetical protein [Halorubrum sp. LN27]|uniref:hypothetical protein n=1 Tax=Halorubrum sp. LN27 TaxID=2801032 RepID=UPI001909C459|nr:hypothetical protein [Halorubrum sp. LN27]